MKDETRKCMQEVKRSVGVRFGFALGAMSIVAGGIGVYIAERAGTWTHLVFENQRFDSYAEVQSFINAGERLRQAELDSQLQSAIATRHALDPAAEWTKVLQGSDEEAKEQASEEFLELLRKSEKGEIPPPTAEEAERFRLDERARRDADARILEIRRAKWSVAERTRPTEYVGPLPRSDWRWVGCGLVLLGSGIAAFFGRR